jgi:hypothetical protein
MGPRRPHEPVFSVLPNEPTKKERCRRKEIPVRILNLFLLHFLILFPENISKVYLGV